MMKMDVVIFDRVIKEMLMYEMYFSNKRCDFDNTDVEYIYLHTHTQLFEEDKK